MFIVQRLRDRTTNKLNDVVDVDDSGGHQEEEVVHSIENIFRLLGNIMGK